PNSDAPNAYAASKDLRTPYAGEPVRGGFMAGYAQLGSESVAFEFAPGSTATGSLVFVEATQVNGRDAYRVIVSTSVTSVESHSHTASSTGVASVYTVDAVTGVRYSDRDQTTNFRVTVAARVRDPRHRIHLESAAGLGGQSPVARRRLAAAMSRVISSSSAVSSRPSRTTTRPLTSTVWARAGGARARPARGSLMPACARSSTRKQAMSAHLPGSRLPQSSRPRQSAPPRVASRQAPRASSACAEEARTRASRSARCASIARFASSLLAEPSTPRPTRAPARTRCSTL